jgi:GTP cyclohydrolase II
MHVPERVIRPHTPQAQSATPKTEWLASAELPTRFGVFKTHVFRTTEPGDGACMKEHVALVFGDIHGATRLPIRIHSECITSEVFGSLKCDCKEQLDAAMAEVARRGAGAILYLRQEGRGIGLANKLHAYALQDQGLDTVEANLQLGFPADKRDYGIGSQILRDLGLRDLRIMTNNPKKIYGIEGYGLHVVEEVPLRVEAGEHNRKYLETKKAKLGHRL